MYTALCSLRRLKPVFVDLHKQWKDRPAKAGANRRLGFALDEPLAPPAIVAILTSSSSTKRDRTRILLPAAGLALRTRAYCRTMRLSCH